MFRWRRYIRDDARRAAHFVARRFSHVLDCGARGWLVDCDARRVVEEILFFSLLLLRRTREGLSLRQRTTRRRVCFLSFLPLHSREKLSYVSFDACHSLSAGEAKPIAYYFEHYFATRFSDVCAEKPTAQRLGSCAPLCAHLLKQPAKAATRFCAHAKHEDRLVFFLLFVSRRARETACLLLLLAEERERCVEYPRSFAQIGSVAPLGGRGALQRAGAALSRRHLSRRRRRGRARFLASAYSPRLFCDEAVETIGASVFSLSV